MCAATRLSFDELNRTCSPSDIPFETTADARGLEGVVVGQERATEALRFGIGIRRHGYNLFAMGPPGVGKQTLLRQLLGRQSTREQTPSDWCYVYNFASPEQPRALELPAGMAVKLERDMSKLVIDLGIVMRSAFEGDDYRSRKQKLVDEFKERQERALGEIRAEAKEHDVAVVTTEGGIVLAPLRDGSPIDAEAFEKLPEEDRKRYEAEIERVGTSLQALHRKFHEWAREHHDARESLDRELAAEVTHRVLVALRSEYTELQGVLEYLDQVEQDAVDNAQDFLQAKGEGMETMLRRALGHEQSDGPSFRRYRVNVLVDRSEQQGAPVVYEDNPTHANLVGRIEHETQFGSLIANFTLIRAGAFHRANGGYLILDVRKVLQSPMTWEALKRVIRSREIRIESLGQALGLIPTVSLEPAPVPFGTTKVVLVGDRILYYLLSSLDPDFLELFKVLVDFEDSMDRTPEGHGTYANLVATLVAKERLRPFHRGAVARVIDHAARSAGDADKLSVHMRVIVDLLQEADFSAAEAGREVALADDVEAAIEGHIHRSGRVHERMQEAVRRGDLLVSTSGEHVGQVNGLSVYRFGQHEFGHPTRITARVRLGKGEVLDIEREVSLGGPIHSKGVLILSGYLGERYTADAPLSLSASLVFEQSYGSVEGDSASVGELCALLSALSGAPIRQSLAVTGSVNQHGEVQPIGGVNEKIEGFFDVCKERGLTREQGVVIPRSNVKNLMLRRDVLEAIEREEFHVHAVDSVDDALELLTGQAVGSRDETGQFPADSVNGRVTARLVALAHSARAFMREPEHGASKPD